MAQKIVAQVAGLLFVLGTVTRAQTPLNVVGLPINAANVTTGSIDEENLFLLQLVGAAPSIQTGIRDLSLTTIDSLTAGVRGARPSARSIGRFRLSTGALSFRYNTARPSDTTGVVWAGRGATIAGSWGGVARVGIFSFALRPVAFWSENRPFAAIKAYQDDNLRFPMGIDLPMRFGERSYARFDMGESWAQVDTRWVAGGISTATQTWGPMHAYPLLLAPEAGGFPHVFLGSGLPWNVGVGRVSARMAVGRLDRSAFAYPTDGDPRRLASELVAVFTPAGMDGLEIGAGRFFHRRWPTDGIDFSVVKIPLESLLKEKLKHKDDATSIPDNQLASLFFRLRRPANGIEVYGEFLRDDHNYDVNDLVGEPDHESAYALGLRKAWVDTAHSSITALTVEWVNGRISHLAQKRGESPMYVHGQVPEGHTEHGKLLGSPAAMGYGYHADLLRRDAQGRGWRGTLALESDTQNQEGGSWSGTYIGQYVAEYGRILPTAHGTYEVSLRGEQGWNAQSGGLNIGLYFTFHPSMPQ